jgi:queuine tRNA-ribosyltransferase
MTPESAWESQRRLGATIAMQLDVCPPGKAPAPVVEEAVGTTTRWLDRTVAARGGEQWPALFGIVQGGTDVARRLRHLGEVAARPLDGTALGGLSVGEERERTDEVVAAVAPRMPAGAPRYLMGMGTPRDLLHAVACGVDMFDCVLPTRGGRHGQVFSSRGAYSIKLARWKDDDGPLDPACGCATCRRFARRYLRHLFTCGEPLAARLVTLHNVAYYCSLVAGARAAIAAGGYAAFRRKTEAAMNEYDAHNEGGNNE